MDLKPHLPTIAVAILALALFFWMKGRLNALETRVDSAPAAAPQQLRAVAQPESEAMQPLLDDSQELEQEAFQGEEDAAAEDDVQEEAA